MKIKRKALIVENLFPYLDMARKVLESNGIDVLTATNYYDSIELLGENLFHFALVDIDLEDKNDLPNSKGIDVLKQIKIKYPECYRLIYTDKSSSYSTEVINSMSVPDIYAHGCYLKNYEKTKQLNVFVDTLWNNFIKINHNIIITPNGFSIEELLKDKFSSLFNSVLHESFLSLIGKIFFGADDITEVELFPFRRGHSKTILLEASIQSNLLKDRPGKRVIIKFGFREMIEQESKNYDRYVQWYLTLNQSVQKIDFQQLNDYAVILYTFAGDSPETIRTFSDIIKQDNISDINEILLSLNRMFSSEINKRDWYHNKVIEKNDFIKDFYVDQLDDKLPSFAKRFQESILYEKKYGMSQKGQKIVINRDSDNYSIMNPYSFVERTPFPYDYLTCIIHGDLNCNNIIFDNAYCWYLIDYAHTGRGHVFYDCIALELSIRSSMLWENNNLLELSELYKFEKTLLEQFINNKMKDIDIKEFSGRTLNIAKLILKIRYLAFQIFPDEKMDNYLIGLLLSSLNWFFYDLNNDIFQKQHYILLGGIISEYFDDKYGN